MDAPPDKPLVERTEWILELGEPRPRSRFLVAYAALFVAFGVGVLLWYALLGGWKGSGGFSLVASFFLGLWLLADTGGSSLYAHRGAAWGRGLRVFGYAVFLPLAMAFYLTSFWFWSTWFFVAEALFVGGLFGHWAVRSARRARGT